MVITNESQENINRECKEAKKNALTEIEDRLKMLTHFSGISIGNIPGENLDQRLKARHNQAMAARNFLNAYDHYAAGRSGDAPNSDFDPKLMRIIVLAVQAHDAFEAARKDIVGNLITRRVMTAITNGSFQSEHEECCRLSTVVTRPSESGGSSMVWIISHHRGCMNRVPVLFCPPG